jgi:hypothetical protein
MKHVVDCIFGAALGEADPTHEDIMRTITAVYDNAAVQGGRIVAGYTMHLGLPQREHLFLVTELPDAPESSPLNAES